MSKKYQVAILTGGFDPITPAHIEYFKAAKEMFDIVIVFTNSDDWLKRKKGKAFMPQKDRIAILKAVKYITQVEGFTADEDADGTAIQAIPRAQEYFPDSDYFFCNGGDRKPGNTPEEEYCKANGINRAYGVGGEDKQYASSIYLSEWVKKNGTN